MQLASVGGPCRSPAAGPLLLLLLTLPVVAEALVLGDIDAWTVRSGDGARGGHPSIKLRPNAGGGADVVSYGLSLRSISDIDFTESTFTCDLALMLSWVDARAAAVVPEGHANLSLSDSKARSMIWVPDVTLTNYHSVDTISTTYQVSVGGRVTKVQRLQASLINTFDTKYFPFDRQVLLMKVSSRTHMLEELRFRPLLDDSLNGVADGTFDASDFQFVYYNSTASEEIDGPLRKSRGIFSVTVARRSSLYFQSLLLPELLILSISWTVFWYPLTAPFAMPRVATALISFLSLVMLEIRTQAKMPVTGDLSWIGLFEMNCQSLMFMNVCLNIFILVVYHRFKEAARAKQIQREVNVIFPILAMALFSVCAFTSSEKASLGWLGGLSNSLLTLFFIGFICFQAAMLKRALDKLQG